MRSALAVAFLVFVSLLSVVAPAQSDFGKAADSLSACKTEETFYEAVDQLPDAVFEDPEIAKKLDEIDLAVDSTGKTIGWQKTRDELVFLLRSKVKLDAAPAPGKLTDPGAKAKEILANPLYRDPGPPQQANWLQRIFTRIGEALSRLVRPRMPRMNIGVPGMSLVWLPYVAWTLLALALVVLLVFFFKQFSWRFNRRFRKVGGLLEDEEPERTADEWLTKAAELEAQGKYREAVRCLYLACLMKLDDANVSRFRRSETNWEHLARFEASPRKPEDFSFREPTRAFDLIWYGRVTKGQPDVAMFRQVYEELCRVLIQQRNNGALAS